MHQCAWSGSIRRGIIADELLQLVEGLLGRTYRRAHRVWKQKAIRLLFPEWLHSITMKQGENLSKTTVWWVSGAMVKNMNKRLFNVSKDGHAKVIETYKVCHSKELLIQALSRYSWNGNVPKTMWQGILWWKNLLRDADKQKAFECLFGNFAWVSIYIYI